MSMSLPAPVALFRAIMFSLAFALLLSACSSTPALSPAPVSTSLTAATPQQMVATVRAAASSGQGELVVQPLRDSRTAGLREQAARLEVQAQYAEAAVALDRALAIAPDDPALLQERAEAALLLRQYSAAEAYARRAWSLGSKVGPLCRRHWATVQQTRLVAGDRAGAAAAREQIAACQVEGPNRF